MKSHFFIPNVFSPDGDDVNDKLAVTNNCWNQEFELLIYNRWGVKLYMQRSPGACSWDGAIEGEFASDGTYFVIVQFDNKVQTTSVTLFRD